MIVLIRFRAAIMLVAAWQIACNICTICTLGHWTTFAPSAWFTKWALRDGNYPNPSPKAGHDLP